MEKSFQNFSVLYILSINIAFLWDRSGHNTFVFCGSWLFSKSFQRYTLSFWVNCLFFYKEFMRTNLNFYAAFGLIVLCSHHYIYKSKTAAYLCTFLFTSLKYVGRFAPSYFYTKEAQFPWPFFGEITFQPFNHFHCSSLDLLQILFPWVGPQWSECCGVDS